MRAALLCVFQGSRRYPLQSGTDAEPCHAKDCSSSQGCPSGLQAAQVGAHTCATCSLASFVCSPGPP